MEQQYVSIETKDDVSLNNFVTEVRNMNISEILNKCKPYRKLRTILQISAGGQK